MPRAVPVFSSPMCTVFGESIFYRSSISFKAYLFYQYTLVTFFENSNLYIELKVKLLEISTTVCDIDYKVNRIHIDLPR